MERMSNGTRVALYARCGAIAAPQASLDRQVRTLRAWVDEHVEGANVAVFVDTATAGDSSPRPGFDALREAVSRRTIDVLVSEDATRLSRSAADLVALLALAADHGVRVVALSASREQGR